MALTYLKGRIIHAQSTDAKPAATELPAGWKLFEQDTGKEYLWDGAQWIYLKTSDEAKNKFALQPRSSFIQLFGDTFAKKEASAVFLLEDLTDQEGGNSLTNNGSISLTRKETDLPLRDFLVPTLNGSSQYFSLNTEAKVEVGTDSFVAKIDFKRNGTGLTEGLVGYGDSSVSEQYWRLYFVGGQLSCEIDDGTTSRFLPDPVFDRWSDNEWHRAVLFVDRTADIMYLFCDGELLGTNDISSVTGTLNNVGTDFIIGALDTGSVTSHFGGELSNCQLYKDSDPENLFEVVRVLNSGIREAVVKGTPSFGNTSTSTRMLNLFGHGNVDTDYFTTIINTSEGIYDLIELYQTDSSHGITELSIDGIIHSTTDRYTGSGSHNNRKITRDVFLSAGTHVLKYRVNGKNGSSSGFTTRTNMIELVKRDGEFNKSDEATRGVLFGDEVIERVNDNLFQFGVNTFTLFNSTIALLAANASGGEFFEGDMYLKRGMYKFTVATHHAASRGLLNVYFGGVKVFDQVDTAVGTSANVLTTQIAFLEGGKTNVRFEIDTTTNGTDFELLMSYLRFELISGDGEGDNVKIWACDDDFTTVSGTAPVLTLPNTNRFNQLRNNATDLLNDEITYQRFFSGGTYIVKHLYDTSLDGGQTDISVNGTVIINNLDQQAAASQNNEHFEVVNIPRGIHTVSIRNVLDGGTNDFQFPFTLLEFTKISGDEDSITGKLEDVTYVSIDNVSNPPTKAELETAFGPADQKPKGWQGLVDDNGANTTVWKVWIANNEYWYEGLTKAT